MGGIKNPALSANLQNLSGEDFFAKLLPSLITLGFVIGSIVFVITLIVSAVQWISSGGDKAKVEEARSRLTGAIVGIVILFAVFAIISVVDVFFGIKLTILDIESLKLENQ